MSHWTDPLRRAAYAEEGIEDGWQYDTFADWWRGCQRSYFMLWLLEEVAYPDDRKLRLLARRFVRETQVDDTRTAWDLLTDERSRSAVEVLERYAVGEATKVELEAAASAASAVERVVASAVERVAAWAVARAAASAAEWTALRAAEWAAEWTADRAAARAAEGTAEWAAVWVSALAQQADIIRDMIPVEEIAPLFERYIERLQGGDR